jgi:peptide/nickel transport system substrate-binding protein
VDQAELPDSLDPAVSFSTPGWGAIQQVYQGLVNYNGSSSTSFVGVLAQSWSASLDPNTGFTSYTFHLRPGVQFSNGDPYNAYVQWYSLYRSLLLAQGPQFILEQNFYSTNFSLSNPLSYYSPLTAANAANTTLADDLNAWNFFTPSSGALSLMEVANQSFQVVNNLTIQLNLGYGYLASNYTYLLAALSAPTSYAVDPAWIDSNGGVSVADVSHDYLTIHTLGTGQFLLQNYNAVEGGGYLLTPNPNYWGRAAAAAEPWNTLLQPANTSVQIRFQSTMDVAIADLENGAAASATFPVSDPSTINGLSRDPCLSVRALPTAYGATTGSDWVFLNQSVFPFNNLSVREAIAHAVNYSRIIDQAFGGYASQWVGPVPPSYPYYDPSSLAPYSFNLALAKQEIADSPCASNACLSSHINYGYLDVSAAWAETAQFLTSDLFQIGLTLNPVPLSLPDLYVEQSMTSGRCTSSTTANGGPYYMGQEFYTSDYFAPDDWTMQDAYSHGSANVCMAGYNNATMDSLVFGAAADPNPADLTADYTQMTNLMYNNYTDIWLAVPTAFSVSSMFLHGVIPNPMASAEPFAMLFNTQWAKNPGSLQPWPVDFYEHGLPAQTAWSISVNGSERSSTGYLIVFNESDGHYAFTVGNVTDYQAVPASGVFVVNGTSLAFHVNFSLPIVGGEGSTLFGLSGSEGFALLVGIVVAVVVVAVVVVWVTRRGKLAPGPPTGPGPPTPPPPGAG